MGKLFGGSTGPPLQYLRVAIPFPAERMDLGWMPRANCYMEVAVNTSIFRISRYLSLSLVALVVGLAAGCADTITFSKDSRAHGLELMKKQQYAEAAGAFRNGVRQNPTDYESYYYLGQANDAMNQRHDAIAAYKTCLEVMDRTPVGRDDVAFRQNVLNAMAQSIAKSDTYDAEVNALETKARGRSVAEDYFLLGKIYAFRGDADSAIDAYNRASKLDPGSFYITKEYGLYLERLGQNTAALPLLKHAYAMNGNDPQVTAALRRLGVVPGPSLKDQSALAKPIVPKGPIPPVEDWGKSDQQSAKPLVRPAGSSAQVPKD
jgi:tetratricopeptide (TPR) repeat protein